MAITKKERDKAYDAGQAAKLIGAPDWGCPFPEGSEERDAYFEGKNAELADKWLPGGRNIYVGIEDKVALADKAAS